MIPRLLIALVTLLPKPMGAQSDYYRHVFFDHSLPPERYFPSRGQTSDPSTLVLDRGGVPVDTARFLTPRTPSARSGSRRR